jgi:hypothetical protein
MYDWGGAVADAIAGAGGLELAELVPLLSPTCRHDNIIGLLGVVLDHRQQAQMLVLELAQVCHHGCFAEYLASRMHTV